MPQLVQHRQGSPARRLSPREALAIGLGAAVGQASRAAGKGAGATAPGVVASRVAPGLLATLSQDRCIALVSGTNGKTTTSRMLADAVATSRPVLANSDGSNLPRGVLSALMTDRSRQRSTCVFEVDELALASVSAAVQPRLFVLGNLSRDQLDRMTEVQAVGERWTAVLAAAARRARTLGVAAPIVVANCDDPHVAAAVLRDPADQLCATTVWVAAGQPWRADSAMCPRCSSPWSYQASYACGRCGFCRPAPTWELSGRYVCGPDGLRQRLSLVLPGRANRANAVLAVAAAVALGVAPTDALAAVRAVSEVGGRYAVHSRGAADVRMLLAKNPASWQEMLAQGDDDGEAPGPCPPLVLVLNAQDADGRDTSWIWDVPFEQLQGRRIHVCGERAEDLALRLRYAGVECSVGGDPLEAADGLAVQAGARSIDLLANYTAFQGVRRQLAVS